MPWNKNDYPQSMKNLDERVRNKAVEIANALLRDGYEEGRAIAIATSQAEEWDENHPEHGNGDKKDRSSDNGGSRGKKPTSKPSGNHALHVVSHEDGWAVKEEGKDKPLSVHDRKEDAVQSARKEADDRDVHVHVHTRDGKIQS
ncbi:DUF2188 domain-containing protein [Saccharibacillus endophyticus]|uniref:DUF2188 domain-containing protein n=1 Tax=Saccharibacillus endophyticus TaxID=2060666 RepID=A0ABQ1ZRV9_9BACL|nr:DUF2188 domain-containing protein [Saccharibacillus endophyticus]GGH72757.1 hypothetical protein GCM10007362_11200 [Saccharibacillus endophyticus]